MKKLVIAALAVLTLGLASCTGTGCWKVTYKVNDTKSTVYVYGDADDVDAVLEKAKAAATLLDQKFTKCGKTKLNKSKDDCAKLNVD